MDKNTLDSAYPFETTLTGFLSKAGWGSKRKLIFLCLKNTENSHEDNLSLIRNERKERAIMFPSCPKREVQEIFLKNLYN